MRIYLTDHNFSAHLLDKNNLIHIRKFDKIKQKGFEALHFFLGGGGLQVA